MKSFLTIILLLLIFTQAKSQIPDWIWAREGVSAITGFGEGWSIATDAAENVFITGWFADSISFGPHVLIGNYCTFLAKYDSSGQIKWATQGLGDNNNGIAVAADVNGNSYLAGNFYNNVSFDSVTLTNAGNHDLFLVKYDSLGNVVWAKSAGDTGDDLASGIATDTCGNVYVSGCFYSPSLIFGGFTLINSGQNDFFLVKYDSSGNVLWAKSAGGSSAETTYSVATDVFGNVYITGVFASSSLILGSDILVNAGSLDIFVAKYDSSGNVQWAKSAGNVDIDRGNSITIDAFQNIYLTGYFNSLSVFFDSYILTSAGGYDAFIVKYDSSGNVLWAKSVGGLENDNGYCVATDKYNKIYLIGGSPNGALSVTIDTATLQYPTGSIDPSFIIAYDSTGHVLFTKVLSSGADDQIAIAVSLSESIYVGGDFETNPFIIGGDSLILTGEENVFVAKLAYSSVNAIFEIDPVKECKLFPNPFNDELNILIRENEQTEIILYDILSRKLLQQTFTRSTKINTEQLPKGIYIYEVRNQNVAITKGKVINQ